MTAMTDAREYFVILREPGSEECWSHGTFDCPEWRGLGSRERRFKHRMEAHEVLFHTLRCHPDSRAIVARVRETTVEEPERTVWVVRDAEGRYLAPEADWSKHRSGAMHFFRRDAAVRELFGYPAARSIEPIEIPGETKIVREILPEVEP